jgi:hypothetical protein
MLLEERMILSMAIFFAFDSAPGPPNKIIGARWSLRVEVRILDVVMLKFTKIVQ